MTMSSVGQGRFRRTFVIFVIHILCFFKSFGTFSFPGRIPWWKPAHKVLGEFMAFFESKIVHGFASQDSAVSQVATPCRRRKTSKLSQLDADELF